MTPFTQPSRTGLRFTAAWILSLTGGLAVAGCTGLDKSTPTPPGSLDLPAADSPAAGAPAARDKYSAAPPSASAAQAKPADPVDADAANDRREPQVQPRAVMGNADRNKTAAATDKPKLSKKEAAQALAKYWQDLAKAQEVEQGGNHAAARALYEQLIAAQPDQYEAYHRLALVADGQRRYQDAQALYTQAIRLNNHNPDLFNDLGYSFYLQGKLSKAESALRKAVAMRPAEGKYRNNLGLVYGHQKRDKEALEEFRHAGSEADAYYNLAFVKASQNDLAAAKDCFHHALAVDPMHEQAARALRAFELAEKQPEAAARLAELADSGTGWVPYVEPGELPPQPAADASAHGPERAASAVHTPTQSIRTARAP
ncbi:MAG: tetratricopeptide repeat protein [Thermoguttaceae bacterium]|jgi:Tfp pilus assembly protein PilF